MERHQMGLKRRPHPDTPQAATHSWRPQSPRLRAAPAHHGPGLGDGGVRAGPAPHRAGAQDHPRLPQGLAPGSGLLGACSGACPTLDHFTVRLGEAFTDWLRSRGRLTRWHGENPAGKPLSEETIRTYLRAVKAFSSWLAAPK